MKEKIKNILGFVAEVLVKGIVLGVCLGLAIFCVQRPIFKMYNDTIKAQKVQIDSLQNKCNELENLYVINSINNSD